MRLDATNYADAAGSVIDWARAGESRYLCGASINNVMEAHDSRDFLHIMNEADLVTRDGMPLAWGLRMLGAPEATRVYGPDLTPVVLGAAERAGGPVGLYGAGPGTLEHLFAVVRRRYPALEIAYAFAPGSFLEIHTDQGLVGIGPDVDPSALVSICSTKAAAPMRWPES